MVFRKINGNIGTFFFRTVYLFGFWILLSGKLELFYLIAGFLGAKVIAYLSLSENPKASAFVHLPAVPGIAFRAARYVFWLLGRIVLAALHVAGIILNRRMPVAPEVVTHKTFLKENLERVIFAHSITLTPGTITADLQDSTLTIHRLDKPSYGDIESGLMEREIQKIFNPGGQNP